MHIAVFSNEQFETGKIINRVYCLEDSTHSYALYLPSSYSTEKTWPIIYFFEPAARAKLLVEKYATLAEEFGYILVCTYNSQNGPRDTNLKAAEILINDTFAKLSLDKNRLYTSGFSGGSRHATLVAIFSGEIKGVIACGAGFPYDQIPTPDLNFDYFGIVGRLDLNYQEMTELENELSNQNINSQLEYFNDEHIWPPVETYRKAFLWMETNAMRDNLINRNDSIISEIRNSYQTEISNIPEFTPNYWRYRTNNKYINYLKGLADVTLFENEASRIFDSEDYKSELEQFKEIAISERAQQQIYNEEFGQISLTAIKEDYPVRPLNWWKKELEKIKVEGVAECSSLEYEMNKRLQNFIFVVSYEEYVAAFASKKYLTAIKLLQICELSRPEAAWVNYLLARAYIKSGDEKQALKQLQISVDKGYSNISNFQNDEYFANIRRSKKFKSIVEEIKNNSE